MTKPTPEPTDVERLIKEIEKRHERVCEAHREGRLNALDPKMWPRWDDMMRVIDRLQVVEHQRDVANQYGQMREDEIAALRAQVQQAQIDCPACGQVVKLVVSATLSLALWQHWNWTCPKQPLPAAPGSTPTQETEKP